MHRGGSRKPFGDQFQSTPPVAGGRCPIIKGGVFYARCFNPRPPLPGGDAHGFVNNDVVLLVSIHAPRCRGAMQRTDMANPGSLLLFQSTPPVAGGRCPTLPPVTKPAALFQSTPPVAGGRCPSDPATRPPLLVSIHAPRCRGAMPQYTRPKALTKLFQSTPPVAGGRCAVVLEFLALFGVSIHAPRCRGAMLCSLCSAPTHTRVSIHAPRCRGAMRGIIMRTTVIIQFQSTPPVAGGRCWNVWLSLAHHRRFQSTPPVAGGRCLAAAVLVGK